MKTITIILICITMSFAQKIDADKEVEKILRQYKVAKICIISHMVATGILGLIVLRIEWDLNHTRRSLIKLENRTLKLKQENEIMRKAIEGFNIKALLLENEEETK